MRLSWWKKAWDEYKRLSYGSLLPLKKEGRAAKATGRNGDADLAPLSGKDREWVRQIRQTTSEKNRDNVERTKAYLDFYQRHPEIHWALLAHLVSRNAGWNMTDLRGELLPRLLSAKEQEEFFNFLERGNWLIFHDAYPQLLVYEESVRRQTNLFHVLPSLQVSSFMQGVWNRFWKSGDLGLLAVGQIINEQHYLEQHLMREAVYQETVLQTLEFTLQEVLGLNQILIPCQQKAGPPRLIGDTVSHFAARSERIALGKRLYVRLFINPGRLEAVREWASTHPHTGSRKDYWPHLFHDVRESVPGKPYQKKLENCQLKSGSARFYSPVLRRVWGRISHNLPSGEDWYRSPRMLGQLHLEEEQGAGEMEQAYCKTLEMIELAVIAHGKIFHSRPI